MSPEGVAGLEGLDPYRDSWDPEDPHANFKSEVALYTVEDPLPTFQQLSATTGIPVGALVRYVLVKWASEGTEAILSAGPRLIRRMEAVCTEAQDADTDRSRLEAYETLRQMIAWLQIPLTEDLKDV